MSNLIGSICVTSSKNRIFKFAFWILIIFKFKHKYLAFLKKNCKIWIPNININNLANHTLSCLLLNSRAEWEKYLNIRWWGIRLRMEAVWYLKWRRLIILIIVFHVRAVNMKNFRFLFNRWARLLILLFGFERVASGRYSSE